jgi:hypothetical protein
MLVVVQVQDTSRRSVYYILESRPPHTSSTKEQFYIWIKVCEVQPLYAQCLCSIGFI